MIDRIVRRTSLAAGILAGAAPALAATATGIVFHDADADGARGAEETGIAGVRVSNGRDVVATDKDGRYSLEVDDDDVVFVVKPSGYRTGFSPDMLPRFSYVHKPEGSPKTLKYAGVAPTGPLPASIDFGLVPQDEPESFKAILFGDPQPRDEKEIEYIGHDVVEELVGTDAAFGVSLGDVMFNDLSLFESLNAKVGKIGIPWYNVIGNHDLNFDTPSDELSAETWKRVYGPPYYSFDFGPAHFIALDNVHWRGWDEKEKGGNYGSRLGADQLQFLRNDLSFVPREKLVVLFMHIPITETKDREDLFRLIEDRPATLSVSGHTHYQEHRFLRDGAGWKGPKAHHHIVNVTVSGSWWSGAPDEVGIPNTTMRCGAPNGYGILTMDGADYRWEFKAARRPADYQMNIFAPERVAAAGAAQTEVLANVFGGSNRSKVEMKLGAGEWLPMERVEVEDPYYLAMKRLEKGENPPPGRKLPDVIKSSHIWRATLPAGTPAGTHLIEVRSVDMFGQVALGERVVTVE